METIVWIVLATLGVSLISLVGIFTLWISDRFLDRILLALVGLAAGTMLGGAFIHLLPEAIHEMEEDTAFLLVLAGFVLFFVLEKLLWRHCHDRDCHIHTFAYINLVGDGIHNFMDGLIIAASFLASTEIGLAATLAVAVHEIPQEIGDYGVLVYGGIPKRRALLFNLLTALTALIGGILGYFVIQQVGEIQTWILPVAAGGFIYIAAADLVPELHKENERWKTVLAFLMLVGGIVLAWLVKYMFEGGGH